MPSRYPGRNPISLNHAIFNSVVGDLHIYASESELIRICFKIPLSSQGNLKIENSTTPILRETMSQLHEYFSGVRQVFALSYILNGTSFQQRAWKALEQISFGETISYGEQARRMGVSRAARAVGTANGQNPIPIIIPCHRVIASDGSLGGYNGGLPIKAQLLNLEARFKGLEI